jgi:proteasome accessory factor B
VTPKANRQLNLVGTLLKARTGMTWHELERVEGYDDRDTDIRSRRRRLERDLNDLETLGLKIIREDIGQGQISYVLDRSSCFMPPLNMTPEDQLLLYRIVAAFAGTESGTLQSHLQTAMLKLQARNGTPDDMPATVVSHSVNRSATDAKRLDVIVRALIEHRRVTFKYRPPGRNPTTRTVAPYSLVARRGGWYLVAYDGSRKGTRTFRLSRIKDTVKITKPKADAPEFEVPPDFDPEAAFSSDVFGRGAGAFEDVRIEFKPEVAFIIENEFESVYKTRKLKDGRLELTIPQAYPDSLLAYLGEFPGFWRVTNPPELQQLIVERLKQNLKAVH